MTITVGFWFVKAIIALAFVCIFASTYGKVDSKVRGVLAILAAGLMWFGAYSLLGLWR